MVTATFHRIKGSYIAAIHGHAKFADQGQDVVCAGASMYAFGLCQCIMQMDAERKFKRTPTVKIGANGEIVVAARPKPRHEAELQHYFHMTQTGFAILKESYPEHVELKTYELLVKEDSDKEDSPT